MHHTKNNTMKREFIIKALIRLKKQNDLIESLTGYGLELNEFCTPISNMLEESIALHFSGNDEKMNDNILENIISYLSDNRKPIDSHAEKFVLKMEKKYKINLNN